MRRSKPYLLFALVVGLLVLAGLLLRRRLEKERRINTALWALVIQKDDYLKRQTAASDVAAFGPDAYPSIARAFIEKDTLLDRAYTFANRKLPSPFNNYFPARPSRAELRRAAAMGLFDMGPGASRALLSEIEVGLAEFNEYEGMMLLRALYWSIPESPSAIQILSNWLAHPKPGKLLFGTSDAREIWPHVPQLAGLLPPWLQILDTTAEAAEALGLMGTNSVFALPLLVDLAKTGLVADSRLHSRYRQGGSPDLHKTIPLQNRAAAIEALGNIGLPTAEVLDVLKEAVTDPSERIRSEAALAFGALGAKALPALDHFLDHIDRTNAGVLHCQLRALATMSTNAAPAIPLLLELSHKPQFSILENFNRIPSSSPMGLHHTWIWRNEPQPGMIAAALALAQIDLEAARDRLDVLALALRSNVSTNALRNLRAFKNELIPQLEPELHVGEPLGTLGPPFGPLGMPILRIILAYNILSLDPENRAARQLLETGMHDPDSAMRCIAAKWFHAATGETNKTIPVLAESLKHVKTSDDQILVSSAVALGPDAKLLLPQIERFLIHPDQSIRHAAGRALRSIPSTAP
jgi:HEAT repeat protein